MMMSSASLALLIWIMCSIATSGRLVEASELLATAGEALGAAAPSQRDPAQINHSSVDESRSALAKDFNRGVRSEAAAEWKRFSKSCRSSSCGLSQGYTLRGLGVAL